MNIRVLYNVFLVRLGIRQILPSDYINGIRIIVHSDLYELRLYFKIDDRESGQFTNWTRHLQTDYRQDFAQYEFVFDNTVIYILADLLQEHGLNKNLNIWEYVFDKTFICVHFSNIR